MRMPILQACRNGKFKSVVPSADSGIRLLGWHHHKEAPVNIDCHNNGALVIVGIPGKTRDEAAVGDIVVALEIRCGAGAVRGSRRVQR